MTVRINSYIFYFIAVLAIFFALLPWWSAHLLAESRKHEDSGNAVQSLHAAEKAVTVNPVSVNALFALAGAQQRFGHETEARATLTKATELQPFNYATWELLALYERDTWGQRELAREHFEIALRLNPADERLQEEADANQNYKDGN